MGESTQGEHHLPEAGQPVSMRLNQLPADPGGGGATSARPDLASSPAEKQAAANAIDQHIAPDTKAAGAYADADSLSTIRDFDAKVQDPWQLATGLKRALAKWQEQTDYLRERLTSESNALRADGNGIQTMDIAVGTEVRRASPLDLF
ncbi:hypothetical protein [Streptomyces sp. NPDC002671]